MQNTSTVLTSSLISTNTNPSDQIDDKANFLELETGDNVFHVRSLVRTRAFVEFLSVSSQLNPRLFALQKYVHLGPDPRRIIKTRCFYRFHGQ